MKTILVWENPNYMPDDPAYAPRWMAEVKGNIRSSDIRLQAIRMALEASELSTSEEDAAIAET